MTVQVVTASVSIAGEDYRVSDVSYVNDRYNTIGELEATVITERDAASFEEGVAEVKAYATDTLFFTGDLIKAEDNDEISVNIVAEDCVRKLKNSSISAAFDDADVEEPPRRVVEAAGIEDYVINIPNFEMDHKWELDFTVSQGDKVLDSYTAATHSLWYVDEQNVLHVTQTPDIELYELGIETEQGVSSILDTSAGKLTPPYQSVTVYAERATTDTTLHVENAGRHIASNPIIATKGTGEPEYTTVNTDIATQRMAEKVAASLYEELVRQRRGGWIKTVGVPQIGVMNAVEMPERFSGAQYLVSSVEHTISPDDGFTTRIECNGVVGPNEFIENPVTSEQNLTATQLIDNNISGPSVLSQESEVEL